VAVYEVVFCNFRLHGYMRLLESEVKCGQRILIQCFDELMYFSFIAFSLQPKIVVVVYYHCYQDVVGLDWLHVCICRTNPKKTVNSKTYWGIRS
jgi:hypothetical protein